MFENGLLNTFKANFGLNTKKLENESKTFPGITKTAEEAIKKASSALNLTAQQKQLYENDLYQKELKKQSTQTFIDERTNAKRQLSVQSNNAKDKTQSTKLHSMERTAELADLIRDYARNNGKNYDKMNDQDIVQRFSQVNPDKIGDMQKFINGEGSSLEFAIGMGFIDQVSESKAKEEDKTQITGKQIAKDFFGGILDSVTGIDTMIGKSDFVTNLMAKTAKALGSDKSEEELKQSWLDKMNEGADIGQDREGILHNVTEGVADIAQLATTKGAASILGKASKVQNLVKGAEDAVKGSKYLTKAAEYGDKVVKLVEKSPTLTKILKAGANGAADQVLLTAIQGDKENLDSIGDIAEQAAIGGVLGGGLSAIGQGGKKALQTAAKKIELNSLLNPAKLETVTNQLKMVGEAEPSDVGEWLLKRNMVGSKTQIVKKLLDHSSKSKNMVDDVLASSKTRVKSDAAKKALRQLYDDYSKTPGLEEKAKGLRELAFQKNYSLTELNKVKRELDSAYNMFKMNGGETAGLRSEGLREIRKELKTTIENIAEKEGLGNVKLLNNETQVAKTLAEAIQKKEDADVVRALLSPYGTSTVGGLAGWSQGDTLEEKATNAIKGFIVGGVAGSTKFKSYLAKGLSKMGGVKPTTLKEVKNFINDSSTTTLSEEGRSVLSKVLKTMQLDFPTAMQDIVASIKEEEN